MAIQSFKNKELERFFWDGKRCKNPKWAHIEKIAKRKLDMLQFARDLLDLRSPPSNNLELLKGKLNGYYSIGINDQWRVLFKWDGQPYDVDIVDYH